MQRAMQRNHSAAGLLGRFKPILFGTLFGLAAAVLLSLIFSFLMPMSFVPDAMMPVLACAAVFFGAFVSGFVALRMIGSAGLLNGLISGMIFAVLHLAAALLAGGVLAGAVIFICLGLEIAGAILGGLVSVNTK